MKNAQTVGLRHHNHHNRQNRHIQHIVHFVHGLIDFAPEPWYASGIRQRGYGEIMPSKQARAIGLDIAFKMKEMYAQTHELSGGRVWTIVQIAERFGVSESSARRAIMGKGAYRGVQDAVTSQTLRESAERLVLEQKLQDAIEAEKENQPDRLLARLDEGPKAEELFREWQTAPPPVLPSKEEIERMILAEREERAAKARLLGDSKPLADGSNA